MDQALTLSTLMQAGVVFVAFWGAIKALKEFFAWFASRHDREQRWDEMESRLVQNIQDERDKIYRKYDDKLAEMEEQFKGTSDRIDDVENSMKKVNKIILESLQVLIEHAIDGNNTEGMKDQKHKLDKYLLER